MNSRFLFRTAFRSAVGVSLAAALLVGCPSPDETSADICTDLYKAFRGYVDRCGGSLSTKRVDGWQKDFGRVCENQIKAPGASGVASALRACADKLPTASCDRFPECELPPGELAEGAPCGQDEQCKSSSCILPRNDRGEVTGQCGTCSKIAAVGEACASDVPCAPGSVCEFVSGKQPTCRAIVKRKVGETCDEPTSPCEEGLACQADANLEFKCTPVGDIGAACRSQADCKSGLVCPSNKCAAPAKEGEACAGCEPGLRCDVVSRKCARITFVAEGQPCDGITRECETGSCEGVSIREENGGVVLLPGTCVAFIPEGAACGGEIKGLCQDFAQCIGDKCVIPDPNTCR